MPDELPQISLYTIDNSVIMSLLQQPVILQQFPCLADAAAKVRTGASGKRCGRCGSNRRNTNNIAFESLKLCIANSSATRKRELKKHLNAKKIRMVYKSSGGRSIQLTF